MRFPRAALSGAFFVFYGFFALPFAVLLPLPFVPKSWGRRGVRIFYRLFVCLARLTGLYTVNVIFPHQAPCAMRHAPGTPIPSGRVIVMNHVSLIDICVLLAHLPDAVCIAKAAAKRNPFLSAVVRKLFIANDKSGEEMLSEAKDYLARGIHVVVFPQGTRSGTLLRRGAARLALAARAEIEAYHIAYDPVVLAKGQPWWDVGDRIIRITLANRGRIAPEGPNDHRTAVALTARIAEAIA
ncbi:MAG: lysophospholipid acyltransferase family protein [Kiritimatiellia bacterium]